MPITRRLSLFAFALLFAFASQAAGERPNVVFVLIDDLSHYGVTAYGADWVSERTGLFKDQPIATPRIDRLAREGVLCSNAFVYPLCEPTRVALMTGQYNSQNFLQPKALHASQITFGDAFQRAGYTTGIFGKWKQTRGTRATPAKDYLTGFGWDEFCCFDVTDEGRRYLNPLLVENGTVTDYKKRGGVDPATGRRWYGPDICNRRALEFIDRHHDEPFFLYYPMILVHDEHTPTPDTTPPSAFDGFPDINCKNRACPGDDRRYFPDMVAYADKLVGRVVDKLEEHGLREKTLVVVLGDNGTKEPFVHHLPDGTDYPGGKGDTKDNGLHAPLVLSQPGVIPVSNDGGIRRYNGLVDVVDLYPTLGEAAGLKVPNAAAVDGRSFWPQATGSAGEHRDHIYTWYNANRHDTDPSKVMRYAFDKQFKRYAPHDGFPEGRFFDLRNDLLEQAGDRERVVAWGHRHRSGLRPEQLDAEQRAAYDRLGAVIKQNAEVPVTGLEITAPTATVSVGGTLPLACRVVPAEATRQNVVWVSADPGVATVDKFGVLRAIAPGSVRVTAYSWQDARPLAANAESEFRQTGIQDAITQEVTAPWRQLFNGHNLEGWLVKIHGHELGDNYRDTFRVEEGVLRVRYDKYDKGRFDERFGHLFYDESFSHYHLAVEYRFVDDLMPSAPSYARLNSGVMLHAQDPRSMLKGQDWPISVELQFLAGLPDGKPRATGNVCTPGTHVWFEGKKSTRHILPSTGPTFSPDEWVRAEAIVRGDQITHLVNGEEVLEYTRPEIGGPVVSGYAPAAFVEGLPLTAGYLALQAEGNGIDFRKVEIRELAIGQESPSAPD